jgi:hypothetical protein
LKHSQSYLSLFLFLISLSFYACSQGDSISKLKASVHHHKHSLGSSDIIVKETRYESNVPILFVQLHSNEETADLVTTSVSAQAGIDYLQILNENERLIPFRLENTVYQCDPNRIFSKDGIVSYLQTNGTYSDSAFKAIAGFSRFLLNLLDYSKTIVSVHNNTDDEFSLAAYTKNNTGFVFQNPRHDPDDFFITTDRTLFQKLKEKNFNVVLEYSKHIKDDGSLSVYCGRNNIRYVNVEAQHNHQKEQLAMIKALMDILR